MMSFREVLPTEEAILMKFAQDASPLDHILGYRPGPQFNRQPVINKSSGHPGKTDTFLGRWPVPSLDIEVIDGYEEDREGNKDNTVFGEEKGEDHTEQDQKNGHDDQNDEKGQESVELLGETRAESFRPLGVGVFELERLIREHTGDTVDNGDSHGDWFSPPPVFSHGSTRLLVPRDHPASAVGAGRRVLTLGNGSTVLVSRFFEDSEEEDIRVPELLLGFSRTIDQCSICFSGNRVVSLSCDHSACAECVRSYLDVQLEGPRALAFPKCFAPYCNVRLDQDEIEMFASTKVLEQRSRRFATSILDARPCPDCGEHATVERHCSGPSVCVACEHRFCPRCLEPSLDEVHSSDCVPHPEGWTASADQHKRVKRLLEEVAKESDNKSPCGVCPNCDLPCERGEGCSEVNCPICGLEFCIYCSRTCYMLDHHTEDCPVRRHKTPYILCSYPCRCNVQPLAARFPNFRITPSLSLLILEMVASSPMRESFRLQDRALRINNAFSDTIFRLLFRRWFTMRPSERRALLVHLSNHYTLPHLSVFSPMLQQQAAAPVGSALVVWLRRSDPVSIAQKRHY